ncbi:MAG: sulfurtransferase [Parahaliea sp.]
MTETSFGPAAFSSPAALIEPRDAAALDSAIIVDCRFNLNDPDAGHMAYRTGHIPGAYYLDLARDLSAPVAEHGGRHPLPLPDVFAATLAQRGIHRDSHVIAYDDSGFVFAARLWWMMRSLGYKPPRLLNGGYKAWLAIGGQAVCEEPRADPCETPDVGCWTGSCDIAAVRAAQVQGVTLVDSREMARYSGLEEPIDSHAGHIPGAINRPWQRVLTEDGRLQGAAGLMEHWDNILEDQTLLVYCGSGVSACVNLFSLARMGREDALLYPGSWSDWCSYLPKA